MKKTHMKLQAVGEREDKKAVERARTSTEGRKVMKQFRGRHKAELARGEDPRSHEHMLKNKEKRLKKGGFKKGAGPGGEYMEKSWKKIQQGSRPTRSKLIIKRNAGGKGNKGGAFKKGGRK
jgi:hypothetical protein